MKGKFDFAGWVTRNDVKCADGRTIRRDAFKHCDGMEVPLVYNHGHDSLEDILGTVLLENRPEGVYGYVKTNSTENGQLANQLVHEGNLVSFSIYANNLTQSKEMDVTGHNGSLLRILLRIYYVFITYLLRTLLIYYIYYSILL